MRWGRPLFPLYVALMLRLVDTLYENTAISWSSCSCLYLISVTDLDHERQLPISGARFEPGGLGQMSVEIGCWSFWPDQVGV